MAAGATSVSLYWDDGTGLHEAAQAGLSADGRYSLIVIVPDGAPSGPTRVCAAARGMEPPGGDLGCASFTVLPPSTGAIAGRVTTAADVGVGSAEVRLTTALGAPVATVSTHPDGSFGFAELPPGLYALGARCPTPAAVGCDAGRDYFPAQSIDVASGALVTASFSPAAPQQLAVFSGFGGVAIPGGALATDKPVLLASDSGGIAARFGSLHGLGFAPLVVRFWADVQFFGAPGAVNIVRFEILRDGTALLSLLASEPQPVYAADPLYDFTAFITDVNVQDLPPGDLTLRITPLVDGAALGGDERTIRSIDLAGRWFNGRVVDPTVTVEADGPDALLYRFTGSLPAPAFAFQQPITLPFDIVLDNVVALDVPIEESFRTDATWSGAASTAPQLKVLGQAVSPVLWSYNGPSGPDFAASTYQIQPIADLPVSPPCIAIPPLSFGTGLSLAPCPECVPISLGVRLSDALCVQTSATLDSRIQADLRFDTRTVTGATISAPIDATLDAAICRGTGRTTPEATVDLSVYYDQTLSPVTGFDRPCVRIGAAVDYALDCLGIVVASGQGALTQLGYGCGDASAVARTKAVAAPQTVASLSPKPAVAADGAGHALAVWLAPGSAGSTSPDRQLVYTEYDGNAWSAVQTLTTLAAPVDDPSVRFLGPNRALAVWVQSTLTGTQAMAADPASLLGSTELFAAMWDGTSWSAPARLTSDLVMDTSPALAANPATGTATVVWMRARESTGAGQQPVAPYAAHFDGTRWSTPQPISATSAALDYQPTVRMDRTGQPVAVWVRDRDGVFETSTDRLLMMARFAQGTWTTAEAIPNVPAGAYSPSLAFDTSNQPILAFVVPPTNVEDNQLGGGDGNASSLYAAYQLGNTWQVGPVGAAASVRAERPIIGVTSTNQAIVMFRRFGDAADIHITGDLASAVRDLGTANAAWTSDFISNDGLAHREVAFDVDSLTGRSFVLDTSRSGLAAFSRASQAAVGDPSAPNRTIVPFAPDLRVSAADTTFSNFHPLVGDSITVSTRVQNAGLGAAGAGSSIAVAFYDGDVLIDTQRILGPLAFGASATVSATYHVSQAGVRVITTVVDPGNAIAESDETNNAADAVLGVPPVPSNVTGQIDAGAGSVTLRWLASSTAGIAETFVYRAPAPDGTFELLGTSRVPSFTDRTATPGVPYIYAVAAVDADGIFSPRSAPTTLMVPAATTCIGDCKQDGAVTVDELITGVNIALGSISIDQCRTFDANGDGTVTIDELMIGVGNGLSGCPSE